jgi:hypothetical protein
LLRPIQERRRREEKSLI